MFDANGTICTDIHKASLEVLSSDEVLKMSVCKVTSTTVFVNSSPNRGGLHDPAMGALDMRSPCSTCGLRRDCPGHLGYIEFPVLIFHPTLLSSLVRLLKIVCFRCCRIKMDQRTANVYLKKFQLVKNGMLEDSQRFDHLQGGQAIYDHSLRTSKATVKSAEASKNEETRRIELVQLLNRLCDEENHRKALCQSLEQGISETHASLEAWTCLRKEFFKVAASRSHCFYCNHSYSVNIKQSHGGTGIQLTWPLGSEKPLDCFTWSMVQLNHGLEKSNQVFSVVHNDLQMVLKEEEKLIHGRRGQVMGSLELLSCHLTSLLEALWQSPDRSILEFLYPMSVKNGWEMFFIRYFPVSSNRFRPLSQAATSGNFGNKRNTPSQQMVLHTRTLGLLDILTASNKFHSVIQSFLQSCHAKDSSVLQKNPSTDRIKKDDNEKNFETQSYPKELSACCKELQQYVNVYIDSTKASSAKGKSLAPGLRQWIEKKEGAIRQKMMGKRVNFVARTVVAPDNCINTNEVGVPFDFAMKLTIPEYVTPQSATFLAKLVENGAHCYPGANMVEDSNGYVYDLAVMSKEKRTAKARSLFSNVVQDGPPKIVYRHLRDGDVVVMNRQPTLHRASMMAHFIRVLPGWRTFRLMYVNCGSYNADFDGDEMNMHLPQDPTSRMEAKSILNADCQYITVKNGEPLRGLIQDHVLGGTFLTSRDTFLDINQYYTLVYSGLESFVDSRNRFSLESLEGSSCNNIKNYKDLELNSFWQFSGHSVTSNEGLQIHIEAPAILKPYKRWTGKQVISTILKTVVDSMARAQFARDTQFLETYDGIHFTAQSKTPGDAWGGVLDGDTEESTLIISQSELLQGVFDKSMIGASSFGLIHFCHELLGPRVAGLLLSVFAKTFTSYLQMRGFSCCTSDFLMTPEGERSRANMIRRCILAGNYAQEIFVDSILREMRWSEELDVKESCTEKLHKVHSAILQSEQQCYQDSKSLWSIKPHVTCHGQTNPINDMKIALISKQSLLTPEKRDAKNTGLKHPKSEVQNLCSDSLSYSKHVFPTLKPNLLPQQVEVVPNLWDIVRFSRFPFFVADWKMHSSASEMITKVRYLVDKLSAIAQTSPRLFQSVLTELVKATQLPLYFPTVSQLLGGMHLWKTLPDVFPTLQPKVNSFSSQKKLQQNTLLDSIPQPNRYWMLSNGRMMVGDGALRIPQLYHPSWLYASNDGFDFEDPRRYMKTSLNQNFEHGLMGEKGKCKPFSLVPNILTRYRLETLVKKHFAGLEASLISMMDGFVQTVMGKLTSRNNDLVSGCSTLYKFPQNGFASMITTGAKGSKVNFAMIGGILSQQSLEGRRVPVMISGKTLPSFGFYDFGARAGGLVTDCYLQGLRPQEFFFHCMAGREGLVDTAVKTARSGYLQRCVMKGMEGILVQYDGTVRDSDGTIIQFLYGDDGLDVSKASYHKKIEDLLQNPTLIKARYACQAKMELSKVERSLKSIRRWNRHAKKQKREHQSQRTNLDDPLTNIFSPIAHVGCTSEKYYQQVKELLRSNRNNLISEHLSMEKKQTTLSKNSSSISLDDLRQKAQRNLKLVLLMKYSQALCPPGEAVGCISAQSMGEPATQMTLNTFHLAGHGAANVTLGIPRLKEILQTAGMTKTPMIYAPVKGESHEEAALHAETALLGLKRIPLSDVIHAVGVESNVYVQNFQSVDSSKCPEQMPQQEFFWEYETTIQFENLDHFSRVVQSFTPQYIIITTLNRIVRDMAKQVNRLVYLYASNYADEEPDSETDELGCVSNHYIFDRYRRSHFMRRDLRKERARTAGIGFGKQTAPVSSLDLLTGNVNKDTFKLSGTLNELEDERSINNETGFSPRNKMRENNSADSDDSIDDSEEVFSESEKGDDARIGQGPDIKSDASDQGTDPDVENDTGPFQDNIMSDKEDNTSLSSRDNYLSSSTEKSSTHQRFKASQARCEKVKSQWENLLQDLFDYELGVSKATEIVEPKPECLPDHYLFNNFGQQKQIKLKALPQNSYRYLTDIQVSRRCWTIRVKFGWPYEKCPRRIILLDHFIKIIKKCTLQDTPGISNPRILVGHQTETKSPFEIQCEGSNFQRIFALRDDCIDHTRVITNDIRTLLQFFGVEACRTSIIRELNKVFSVYGITVDYRHMSLIADTMTHSGYFRPFSRLGIQYHSSPLLQMSFETSMKFLTEAIQRRAIDNLKTPAGAIVTGKPVMVGTGLCNVLTKVIIPKKQLRKDRVTRHEIKHESKDFKQTKILPTTLFKPDGKKRATKPESKRLNKKLKFTFT